MGNSTTGNYTRKDVGSDPERVRCEACSAEVPPYDTVSYGSIEDGYRMLCTKCFNADVASRIGLEEFENVHFDQIAMTDAAGKAHELGVHLHAVDPRPRARQVHLDRALGNRNRIPHQAGSGARSSETTVSTCAV